MVERLKRVLCMVIWSERPPPRASALLERSAADLADAANSLALASVALEAVAGAVREGKARAEMGLAPPGSEGPLSRYLIALISLAQAQMVETAGRVARLKTSALTVVGFHLAIVGTLTAAAISLAADSRLGYQIARVGIFCAVAALGSGLLAGAGVAATVQIADFRATPRENESEKEFAQRAARRARADKGRRRLRLRRGAGAALAATMIEAATSGAVAARVDRDVLQLGVAVGSVAALLALWVIFKGSPMREEPSSPLRLGPVPAIEAFDRAYIVERQPGEEVSPTLRQLLERLSDAVATHGVNIDRCRDRLLLAVTVPWVCAALSCGILWSTVIQGQR